jgi:PAS domain S-box-containing protein
MGCDRAPRRRQFFGSASPASTPCEVQRAFFAPRESKVQKNGRPRERLRPLAPMPTPVPAPTPPDPSRRSPPLRARRHDVILDFIDQGFCIVEVLFDATGRAEDYLFLETNAAFARQTGLADVQGRRMRELGITHEDHWFEIYGNVALTGHPVRFTQKARALDDRWYDVYAFRVDEPELRHVAILFTDITDRVHLEQGARLLSDVSDALITLNREEDLPEIIRGEAADFFRISQCALVELDVRQHTARVNRSWDDRGSPPPGSHQFADFVTEELWQAALAGRTVIVSDTSRDERVAGSESFRGLAIGSFVAIPLRRNDQWCHVLVLSRVEPSNWRKDQVEVAHELASRCWTRIERLRAEIAVKAGEERVRLILENAREYAIISMDLERRVTSWSEGAVRLLGYSEEEVLGRVADLVFVPEDFEAGAPGREAALALAEGRAANERWHRRKDGTRFWGSGAMMAIRDHHGTTTGLLKIMRDDTTARLAQQSLEQSQSRLEAALELAVRARTDAEAAVQAKDRFIAALSHELRTPLNPVLMIAGERAADPALPAEVRADFEVVQRSVEHEARLIEDMLDLNLISRGKMSLRKSKVDLHALLRDAAGIVGTAAQEKSIHLAVNPGSPQAHVSGDPARLKQVFLNLLNNAIKFTPAGGQVTVTTREDQPGKITVDVSDTGFGLTPDELERVFEPFAQGNHAGAGGSNAFGGLGLGLAIVRDLVCRHHGQVTGHSGGRGRGATFTVVLPLIGAEAGGELPAVAPSDGHVACLRILLTEDHAPTRTALSRILMQRHHEVTTAGSIHEALAAAATHEFDLLISDIGLPDGDGYQLFLGLRALQPGIRGIALSGFGMESDRARSSAVGFALHLVKPISGAKLDAAIRQVRTAA